VYSSRHAILLHSESNYHLFSAKTSSSEEMSKELRKSSTDQSAGDSFIAGCNLSSAAFFLSRTEARRPVTLTLGQRE
jgi:hypothetical protein